MSVLKSIFTWWDGATIGTALFSRRSGQRRGSDGLGNMYFEGKAISNGMRKRWVIYNGSNDASRVPPEWFGWLHHTHDMTPDALPPVRAWEKPAIANLTGTPEAYQPAGAIEKGGRRAAATGDYEAWSPDNS